MKKNDTKQVLNKLEKEKDSYKAAGTSFFWWRFYFFLIIKIKIKASKFAKLENKNRKLQIAIVAVLFVILIAFGLMIASVVIGNEASKKLKVSNSIFMNTGSNQVPVKTGVDHLKKKSFVIFFLPNFFFHSRKWSTHLISLVILLWTICKEWIICT